MKKKKKITKVKRKQKIDVILESLLNLEKIVKELIKKIDESNSSQPDTNSNPKWDNIKPPKDDNKYWPNTNEPPFKYKDIMWNDNSSSQWDSIDKGFK